MFFSSDKSVPLDIDDSCDSSSSGSQPLKEYIEAQPMPSTSQETGPSDPKIRKIYGNIITTKIVAVLDKCKVSDRDAVHLIAAIAEALELDLNRLSISRSTVRRCRQQLREERAENMKKLFNKSEITAAVIHWDGKILPAITGKEKVERLSFILTSGDKEILLGVPVLPDSTGKEQAAAVYQLLVEWGVYSEVKALCFDTTASNTGYINGACTKLEQNLNKNLLYLPCRHHIFEIVLKGVFDVYMSTPSGPHVPIFKRFQESWTIINKENFKPRIDYDNIKNCLGDCKDDILEFVKSTLQIQLPRKDYRELLELTEIFLGNPFGKTAIGSRCISPCKMHVQSNLHVKNIFIS